MRRVNVYVVEEDASANYRLRWPAEALKAQGLDVEVCGTGVETRDCEVAVFNRPIRAAQAQVVEELVDAGIRVCIDMDDWFDKIASGHAMYGADTSQLHRACKAATAVTVTTPAMLDAYGYGHGTVVPNYVPAWYLDVKPAIDHDKPWVGWFGTVSSHPNDLQVTNGRVAQAMESAGAEFAYIGPKYQGEYVRKFLKWKGVMQLAGYFTDTRMLMEAIASFDVGIVPLENSSFNSAKSRLKGIEYAALGVPFIASPSDEYKRLGAGVLAPWPNDWKRALSRLLTSECYRDEVAGKGREIAAGLTIEKNSSRWADVWAAE